MSYLGEVKGLRLKDKNTEQEHLIFFENLPLYYLDNENRLFLHAGFTSMHGVEKETFKENFSVFSHHKRIRLCRAVGMGPLCGKLFNPIPIMGGGGKHIIPST